MNIKHDVAAMTLAFATGASTVFAQSNLWNERFEVPNPPGWVVYGPISVVNGQGMISGSYGPMPTNSPVDTYSWCYHPIPTSGPLPDQQTLEARVDLVSANQNETWASLQFFWFEGTSSHAYLIFKDQDEIMLVKAWNGAVSLAFFFYENLPLKNENVTLVLSLTRLGSDVAINARVLDKDNANAVLFDHTVTDTPQIDPVLPNRAVKGILSVPDLVGTPWPVLNAPGNVELGMGWANPQSPSAGVATVIFDNLEVWQYESPQLAIRNAVVLSWPLTQGQFVLESAPSVNGPWEPVPDPWWRTNNGQNEVSMPAPDSLRLFRLRQ